MFQKTDFWIGLAVGAVAGIFGYRFMQEREQQMAAMQPAAPAGEIPLAELQRQVQRELCAFPELTRVETSIVTGSILIHYEPETLRRNPDLRKVEEYIMAHARR